MSVATIAANGLWQTVTTTTRDTVFQNRTPREVYILTGSTSGVPIKEGFLLAPWIGAIVIATDQAVSASAIDGPAVVFYMGV